MRQHLKITANSPLPPSDVYVKEVPSGGRRGATPAEKSIILEGGDDSRKALL